MRQSTPFVLAAALLAVLALPALAEETPAAEGKVPAATPAKDPEKDPEKDQEKKPGRKSETDAGKPGDGESNRRRSERFGSPEDEKAFFKQLAEENPELKGVDHQTDEGRKKIREVLEAKHKKGEMPEVGIMMKMMRSKSHLRIQQLFAMPREDFAAIEPLLAKVEQLRAQKLFVDIPTTVKSLGADQMFGSQEQMEAQKEAMGTFIKGLVGNSVDPTVKEFQDAANGLKTLLADPQSTAAEQAAAVARVRKARTAYYAALDRAQLELRSVLTPKQEALLVDYGLLD